MKELLKRIYDAIVPVSRRNFYLSTGAIVESLNGIITATEQQSEMLASLVNQISELQKVKTEKKDNEEQNDPAFG